MPAASDRDRIAALYEEYLRVAGLNRIPTVAELDRLPVAAPQADLPLTLSIRLDQGDVTTSLRLRPA